MSGFDERKLISWGVGDERNWGVWNDNWLQKGETWIGLYHELMEARKTMYPGEVKNSKPRLWAVYMLTALVMPTNTSFLVSAIVSLFK